MKCQCPLVLIKESKSEKTTESIKQTLDKIIEWEKFILKSKKCDFICNKQINEYLNNIYYK